jgi:uncharacterized protein (TIGR00269 family)
MRSIERKTRATIAHYNMLKFDDRIAVAVSGGKDSNGLLHILAKNEKRYSKASIVAITVDEGIKGYRDDALKIAAGNCQKLGVEHELVTFKDLYGYTMDEINGKRSKCTGKTESPCTFCGVLRRKALNIAARKVKANKIATAHTLDDETQTILLNIFHGDILRTAREEPVTEKVDPKLIQKIKPFCLIPERETSLYAYVKKIRFQSRPCPYASDALRNDARAILNRLEEKRPGIKFTIYKSIERIRPSLKTIEAQQNTAECAICGEPSTERICRACQLLDQIQEV